jgi:ATP-dependent DNA helicase RecG
LGLPITDQLLLNLASIKTEGTILPPPTLIVTKRILLGSEVAVISVEPADSPPVRYKGRIHVRFGPRKGIATAQDERILNEKRRYGDLPFDAQPVPTATLNDLNRRAFEDEYLRSAFAPDIIAANERTYEQRLAATKMIASIDEPTPTVIGLLVLGIRPRDFLPGAYIQFLRIAGNNLGDPVSDERVIDGTISDILRRIDDKLAAHNSVAIDFTTDVIEKRRQPYPMVAIQQLVRNCVMHRTYEGTNAPIHVYWYNDRIEITNPGGPYGAVTVETFGLPGVVDYRNPNLAEALRVLGFVQRFGFGIPTARQELKTNGNPDLEFEVRPNMIVARIKAA